MRQVISRVLLAGLLLAGGACSVLGGSDEDPARGVRRVTIASGLRYAGSDDVDEQLVPEPLVAQAFTIYVPDGHEGFVVRTAAPGPGGTVVVDDVPAGAYYLRRRDASAVDFYLVSDADSVDLSVRAPGRPPSFATQPTPVMVAGTGMSPWSAGCFVELYSPGAGAYVYALQDLAAHGRPSEGDVDLGLVLDWQALAAPLPGASASDACSVMQLVPAPGPEQVTLSRLTRSYSSACSLADGQAGTIDGLFVDAPARSLDIDWQRASFFAALADSDAGRPLFPWSTFLSVGTLPHADRVGTYGGAFPDLLMMYAGPDVVVDSEVRGSFDYGDPFPVEWPRFVWVWAVAKVSVELDGLGLPVVLDAASLSVYPLDGEPIAARLSVARAIELDGAPLTAPLRATSRTPTLSWQPPRLGSATDYRIDVVRLEPNGAGDYAWTPLAELSTRATSVQLPPDLLVSGGHYLVRLIAVARAGVDVTRTPGWDSLPFQVAGTWTSTFSAP